MPTFNQYMAERMELWDLEVMTSYDQEIWVRGPVGISRLEFYHTGFTPRVGVISSAGPPLKQGNSKSRVTISRVHVGSVIITI